MSEMTKSIYVTPQTHKKLLERKIKMGAKNVDEVIEDLLNKTK